eukprot:SAG31_NODE_2221_length_6156_cov_5.333994_9_plen_83_part_00
MQRLQQLVEALFVLYFNTSVSVDQDSILLKPLAVPPREDAVLQLSFPRAARRARGSEGASALRAASSYVSGSGYVGLSMRHS